MSPMSNTTCILMHTNRRLSDLGHSCENPAVALWVREGKSPIPVCAAHAANKTTKEISK